MFVKALLGAVFAATAAAQVDLEFTSKGTFKLKNAAFLTMSSFADSEDFLLVSSFGAMSSGAIYVVPDVKQAVIDGDVSKLAPVQLDTPKFEWPNNIQAVPADVFAGSRAIVVPDGFLVPGKKDGGIYLISMDEKDVTKTTGTKKITAKKNNYFYHMGYWIDLNGDGRKDYITARSNAKKGEGELLWLEQPKAGLAATEPWTEHVLGNIADVAFEVQVLDEFKDEVVVFAAQFFDEKLSMHRISTVDGTLVGSKVIDDTNILSAYNVSMVDLNGDGNRQLMVNNHQTKDKLNGIWAYEFPKDLMKDDWKRQTIASNFKNAFSMTVPNMSPGFAYAVYPNGQTKGERAHILVAGDGDHSAHALYPSGNASVFEYTDTVFANAKGTVGALETSDLDQDGWLEVWMPNYDKSYIELFRISAAKAEKASIFLQ